MRQPRTSSWVVTMTVTAFERTEWTVREPDQPNTLHTGAVIQQGEADTMALAMMAAREVIAGEWIRGDHDDI